MICKNFLSSKIQIMVLFTILLLLLSGCKKEEVTNKSYALTLLQNKWTPISSRIFFPNGSNYKLLPFISESFTSDGKVILSNYVYDKIENIIEGFQLLPDDSTLIFSQLVNGAYQVKVGDTSTISTLSDHLLVIYSKEHNFINFIDSLKR
jgi:hypothetical protein